LGSPAKRRALPAELIPQPIWSHLRSAALSQPIGLSCEAPRSPSWANPPAYFVSPAKRRALPAELIPQQCLTELLVSADVTAW